MKEKEKINPQAKSVLQYSEDGYPMFSYPSIAEAARETGANERGIFLCCHNQQITAGGYRWQYTAIEEQRWD